MSTYKSNNMIIEKKFESNEQSHETPNECHAVFHKSLVQCMHGINYGR